MDNKLNDLLKNVDDGMMEKFMTKNKSNLKIIENIERNQFDYSWVEKIEETIEHFDKVVRNPRKFIQQEEEIVPIEKAKKISQETIKHLAQHTNLIQDVDEEGTITPSAVLNIHKEESFDIYENRFVKSLLDNVRTFMYLRKNQTSAGSFENIQRKLTYEGETKLDYDNVKISISMETKSHKDLVGRSPAGLSVEERIERIELILADFYKSPFMKDLQHALPVKSPIRKTNVILKDSHFKKLLTLWEFVERYEVKDVSEKTGDQEVQDQDSIDKMDMAFFIDYYILVNRSKNNKEDKKGINSIIIRKLIRDFYENNDDLDEKTFKKLMLSEFKEVKKENEKAKREINKIVNNSFKVYENIKKDILKRIKKK